MRFMVALLVAGVAACEIQQSPEDARKAREADFEKDYWEKRHAQEAERAQQRAQLVAQGKREQDQHAALSAQEKPAPLDCDTTRPERAVEMKKRLDSIQHKHEMLGWEKDHCQWQDNSKAVVRVLQDSQGEYHWREGRDRGVDRVCNAKPPEEIEHTYAQFLQTYEIPGKVGLSVMACRGPDLDKPETAELAKGYWREACVGWGRNGKTAPPWCTALLASQ